jgi:hypothetical protein
MYSIVRRVFSSGQVYFSVYNKAGRLVVLTKKPHIAEKFKQRVD